MAVEEAPAIVLVFAVLLLILNQLRNRNGSRLKPPHPPSWPIIGHLHLLTEKQPIHRTLSSLSERYGPVMHLQLGCRQVLVISSSECAKECLKTNDKIFASRPTLLAGKHMGYDSKVLPWLPYGPYLRDLRKICALQLFSAHRLESLRHVRVDEVSALVRSLFETSQRQGSTVNMKSRLSQLTFNIILRMVANKNILGAAYSEDSEEARKFKGLIDETFLLAGTFNVADYLPFLQWFDLHGLKADMIKLQKKRDNFMQTLVNDHRERRRRRRRGTSEQTEDLIDVLISATDNHEILSHDNDTVVKASAIGMITAGTDTSAVTIEWALAALLQNPEILRKAQRELESHIGRDRLIEESDLQKLKYLQAIVKETFRLYPAGPILIPHESTEACTVGGYHIRAGTRLLVNVWAIQRDSAVWERPTEFDPGRFLKSERDIDVKGQDFELIPFGSGRRMCPGMSLAMCVVSYTLARLLQSFEWSVPEGTVIEMREGFGLTMPKAVALELVIKPRLLLHLYQ